MQRRPAVLAAVVAAAGCHVTVRTEVTHTVASRSEPRPESARALPATAVLADGAIRFVEPLVCGSEDVVEVEPEVQRATRPNLATFVVGVIATVGGAVAGVSGLTGDDPSGSPLTYAGGAGVAVGLPLVIGPWLGVHTESVLAPNRTERRAGPEVACGSRPITGGFALVTIGQRQAYAAVGDDGALAVSPFTWVDAFDPTGGPAFAIHAELRDRDTTTRTIDKVFEAGALAAGRESFLVATKLDVSVKPMRAVSRVSGGAIRVGHVLIGSQATLHVVVPIVNAGPGEAWQVRAVISAASPELDGRIVYVGHLPVGTTTGELWLPISPEADDAIRRSTLDLTFTLIDAHQTLEGGALAFHGTIEDEGFQ